jgi:D-sedoheptulose 7-phosphate isomerase
MEEYLAEIKQVVDLQDKKQIIKAFDIIYSAWGTYKSIFSCGNGGGASVASHFTTDLTKLGVPAYSLDDNPSTLTMFTNDDGWDAVYEKQLNGKFWKDDVFVCFSVHGGTGKDKAGRWSQNLLRAVDYARSQGGKVISLAGHDGGEIKKISDVCINIKSESTPIIEGFQSLFAHLVVKLLSECKPTRICECGKIRNCSEVYCDCGKTGYRYNIGIVGNIEDWRK